MPALTLVENTLRHGIWHGLLAGSTTAPEISVVHDGHDLGTVTIEKGVADEEWTARIALPASILSDGVQTLLIMEKSSSNMLGQIVLRAGAALDQDICADVALLRAELDMLKVAFRRHCHENK